MPLPLIVVYAAGLLLAAAYVGLIVHLLHHWRRLPRWTPAPSDQSLPFFITVLLPARNEAARIGACLRSLQAQSLPAARFEIIVIDDHSTDGTAAVVQAMGLPNLRLLPLADHLSGGGVASYKKAALALGVAAARGELIVTTDADCRAPVDWLRLLATRYRAGRPAFLTAPVVPGRARTALERFQALDVLGTMVLTGGGIHAGWLHLANGANLAYPKTVFRTVGGFAGIDHLASGDDMLLLQKVADRYPGRIAFVKARAAAVETDPMSTWRGFLQQRLRWATKSSAYRRPQATIVWALVFVVCGALVSSPLAVVAWGSAALGLPFLLLIAKLGADFLLLRCATRFFGRSELMRSFLISQAIHIAYVLVIGLLSNVQRKYK